MMVGYPLQNTCKNVVIENVLLRICSEASFCPCTNAHIFFHGKIHSALSENSGISGIYMVTRRFTVTKRSIMNTVLNFITYLTKITKLNNFFIT